jgi:hypothetical protein
MKPVVWTIIIAIISAFMGTCTLSYFCLIPGKLNGQSEFLFGFIWPITFVSVLFWSWAGFKMRNIIQSREYALKIGLLSPFVGGFFAGLPFMIIGGFFGFAIALVHFYITIPIGILTGSLVWRINRP